MDTLKLVLVATVALLLGALLMSWKNMNTGVQNTPADELARLKNQIAELRQEQDALALERRIQQLKSTQPAETPALTPTEYEAMKAQLEASQAALAELQENKAEKRDAKVAQDEEGLFAQRELERKDPELKRAKMIAQALLIGRVKEYADDPELGGFITFEVLMPEQVQPGVILAVRRKTGILSQFKVSEVTPEGGIANPLPGFGPADVVPGDELIMPPQY